jgi:peptide/nickel transport system substrate-binding protein
MESSNYWQAVTARRLGRRSLLRAGAAVTVTGAAMLAACGRGGGSSSSGAAAPAKSGASGPPQKGGVFAGRLNTDPPTTWMPSAAITYIAVWPMAPAYNQLLQFNPQDPDTKVAPDLADSYETAGDGTSVVFKLHPGVKFHDGSDFSSEDVKATIDWDQHPPAKQTSSRTAVLSAVDRVETPDPLTAKFVLSRPNPSLPVNLANHFGCIGAKSDLAKDNLGTIVNGTGPFKLKAITRGVGVEMERNPNYWVPDRPYLDGVKYSIVVDENTAMTDLVAGHFHRYFPILADNYGLASKQSGGKIADISLSSPNRNMLFFNATKKPFNDPRVRQAVSLVLDRNEGMQIDVHNLGQPGGYMMPSGQWAISSDQLKQVPGYDKPDIAEAKKLLAAAGVTEPLTGSLLNRSDASFQPGMIWVQNTLQKTLGWNFTPDVKDSAAAFAAGAQTQFDLCHWLYSVDYDDPDGTFGLLCTKTASSNWSKVSDPDADALFDKQSQTMDANQRKQLVQELELKYLNNYPSVTLYFRNALHAMWNTVQNYKVSRYLYVNQRFQDTWLTKS